ncbi:unnamed protein product [Pseudo-nitzschia multistriata]|uniref:Uncharacterized protein n=1 Tax=Pseudo-nitzschia multistriata TaxID=183589 RepID=A0A448ZDR3_9STRA|nr:unnamed protein product [Pseudo-nitzschia multistriata]
MGGNGYQNHNHPQQPYNPHHHKEGPSTNLHRRNSGSSGGSAKSNNKKYVNKHQQNNAKFGNTHHPISKPKKKVPTKKKKPLRVLGIALIVDQKGTGARMLARYPTSPSSMKKVDDEVDDNEDGGEAINGRTGLYDRNEDEDAEDDDGDDESDGYDRKRVSKHDDDLFFTLTARQMAKLFRTKRSLCNQPMTLRVNRTVFCCHAVLLEDPCSRSSNNDISNGTAKDEIGSPDSPLAKPKTRNLTQQPPKIPLAPSIRVDRDRDNNSMSLSMMASEADDPENEDNKLRLFSVVVAISASKQQAALPFSSFWETGSGEDLVDLERYIRQGGMQMKTSDNSVKKKPPKSRAEKTQTDSNDDNDKRWKLRKRREQTAGRVSSTFLAIRRVHISLARFCRALEREENRCAYVTLQSCALFKIRNGRQKQWEAMQINRSSASASVSNCATITTSSSGSRGDRSPYPDRHNPRHSRTNSFMSSYSLPSDAALKKAFDNNDVSGEVLDTIEKDQEKEQEILELMLACNPQDNHQQQQEKCYYLKKGDSSFQQRQYGNLIRDLVAVFHSLSRNDQEYPPTPSSLLCERDTVVYVNNHFAIPIDAAGLNGNSYSPSFSPSMPSPSVYSQHKYGAAQSAEGGPVVLPYYTLLFPHASPSEMLQTFHSSGSAPPQQLKHLLLSVCPQKSLTQISIDANLPMHTTMAIASFLVAHGACITSPVVNSRSRLTCLGSNSIQRIRELTLDFSQAFPGVNLFRVVSFLTTSSRHLGDTMAVLADTDNNEGAWLREALLASPKYRFYNHNCLHGGGDGDNSGANDAAAADIIKDTIRNGTHQALFSDEKETYSPSIHTSFPSSTWRGTKPSGLAQDTHHPPPPMSVHEWLKDLEDFLYAVSVWLLSRELLVQLQEYMVAVDIESPSKSSRLEPVDLDESNSSLLSPPPMVEDSSSGTTGTPSLIPSVASTTGTATNTSAATIGNKSRNDLDEKLFKELMAMEYLNGDVSMIALSWQLAIDPRKLRHWGLRHKRVRVISRVPSRETIGNPM